MVENCEKTTGAGGSEKSEGRRLKSVFSRISAGLVLPVYIPVLPGEKTCCKGGCGTQGGFPTIVQNRWSIVPAGWSIVRKGWSIVPTGTQLSDFQVHTKSSPGAGVSPAKIHQHALNDRDFFHHHCIARFVEIGTPHFYRVDRPFFHPGFYGLLAKSGIVGLPLLVDM